MEQIVKLLKENPVFSIFDSWTLQFISRLTKRQTYKPKEWLFRQSEPREWFGIVEKGEVRILPNPEDQESCLATLRQGGILSERILIEDLPHTVSCFTQEGTVIVQLSREALERIRKDRIDLHYRIVARANEIMNDRMRYAAGRPTMDGLLLPEHELEAREAGSIRSILGRN